MESRAAVDPGYSMTIARFAAMVDRAVLHPDVADAVATRIADTVGCIVGAGSAEAVDHVRRMALRYAGTPRPGVPAASVVGSSSKLPLESAAFVNGMAARYLDFNDIYLSKEAVHPSDNIAVALALAEALELEGRALLLAVGRGYEVHCRLADTLSTRKGGWDNVVLGAMAASVMAGSLLGLDIERQAHAINLAAVGNVALMQTRVGTLSMWKAGAAANAARAGLLAALLASEGVTGPDHTLDGTHGLFARVTGEPDAPVFAATTGPLRLLDTHLKAYPSQYFTQTAIDAALAVRQQVSLGSAHRIQISTFEFGRVAAADTPDKWRPLTRETADHSMPYCVAVALLDGAVGEAQFIPERIASDDVRELMARIEVVEDPAFTAAYPSRVPTRIAIQHVGGRTVESTVEYPCGHSRNPMSRAQVEAKFVDLAGGSPQRRAAFQSLWRLETLSQSETALLLGSLLRGQET